MLFLSVFHTKLQNYCIVLCHIYILPMYMCICVLVCIIYYIVLLNMQYVFLSVNAQRKIPVTNYFYFFLCLPQKITFDQHRRMVSYIFCRSQKCNVRDCKDFQMTAKIHSFFQNIFYQQAIMRSKVKSSVSLGA